MSWVKDSSAPLFQAVIMIMITFFLLNVVASLRWLITVDSCAPLRQVGTFLETAHLPLPKANINTYFSLRAKCWIRGGVGGQFPEAYNDPRCPSLKDTWSFDSGEKWKENKITRGGLSSPYLRVICTLHSVPGL